MWPPKQQPEGSSPQPDSGPRPKDPLGPEGPVSLNQAQLFNLLADLQPPEVGAPLKRPEPHQLSAGTLVPRSVDDLSIGTQMEARMRDAATADSLGDAANVLASSQSPTASYSWLTKSGVVALGLAGAWNAANAPMDAQQEAIDAFKNRTVVIAEAKDPDPGPRMNTNGEPPSPTPPATIPDPVPAPTPTPAEAAARVAPETPPDSSHTAAEPTPTVTPPPPPDVPPPQ